MAWFGLPGAGFHKAEIRKLYDKGGPFTATLVREPGNKQDPNAVRVDIAGATVGYVPKEFASAFHRLDGHRVPAEIQWGDGGALEVAIDVNI